MSVFFDAPARLVYTSSRKSQTQEAIGTTGHLTAEKGRRTLFFYRESESNERVMLTTSPVKCSRKPLLSPPGGFRTGKCTFSAARHLTRHSQRRKKRAIRRSNAGKRTFYTTGETPI